MLSSAIIPTLIANLAFLLLHLIDQENKVGILMTEGNGEETDSLKSRIFLFLPVIPP